MKISTALQERLICPHCRSQLYPGGESFVCKDCGNKYPVITGIPVLIDGSVSGFRISSYDRPQPITRAERALRAALPTISMNLAAHRNCNNFRERLFDLSRGPRVLVIGGATAGARTRELLADDRVEFVESDIAIDERTTLVCDAHVLPFADQTFDGVIFQGVMFYLQDSPRCIGEIVRVLKPRGIVYSEAAFMEQVVGGEYDFYRFTMRGHEYQFRQFERIASGISGGPAMATAWSIQYLLLSFTENSILRTGIRVLCKCTLFWMKYLDLVLEHKRGAIDAAAGTYFLGRRPADSPSAKPVAPQPPGAQETVPQQPAREADPQYQGLIRTDVRAFR